MTTKQNTTSTTPNVKAQEHIVTVTPSGELCCDCQRFKVNTVLYGAAECDHTAGILSARKAAAK